jgi:hypothetical protein
VACGLAARSQDHMTVAVELDVCVRDDFGQTILVQIIERRIGTQEERDVHGRSIDGRIDVGNAP